jgi:hypothetical protein
LKAGAGAETNSFGSATLDTCKYWGEYQSGLEIYDAASVRYLHINLMERDNFTNPLEAEKQPVESSILRTTFVGLLQPHSTTSHRIGSANSRPASDAQFHAGGTAGLLAAAATAVSSYATWASATKLTTSVLAGVEATCKAGGVLGPVVSALGLKADPRNLAPYNTFHIAALQASGRTSVTGATAANKEKLLDGQSVSCSGTAVASCQVVSLAGQAKLIRQPQQEYLPDGMVLSSWPADEKDDDDLSWGSSSDYEYEQEPLQLAKGTKVKSNILKSFLYIIKRSSLFRN